MFSYIRPQYLQSVCPQCFSSSGGFARQTCVTCMKNNLSSEVLSLYNLNVVELQLFDMRRLFMWQFITDASRQLFFLSLFPLTQCSGKKKKKGKERNALYFPTQPPPSPWTSLQEAHRHVCTYLHS